MCLYSVLAYENLLGNFFRAESKCYQLQYLQLARGNGKSLQAGFVRYESRRPVQYNWNLDLPYHDLFARSCEAQPKPEPGCGEDKRNQGPVNLHRTRDHQIPVLDEAEQCDQRTSEDSVEQDGFSQAKKAKMTKHRVRIAKANDSAKRFSRPGIDVSARRGDVYDGATIAGVQLPVTAKLSGRFYERFGDQITNELVDWFNSVDTTYQAQVREINDSNRLWMEARFDAFDARMDAFEAKMEAKFDALKVQMLLWMFGFWIATVVPILAVMFTMSGAFRR